MLLECFVNFLIRLTEIRRASDSSNEPHMVHVVLFLPMSTLKVHTKCSIYGTPHDEEWDDITYRKICIAIGVFQKLHQMYKNDGRSFWEHHLGPSYGSHHTISALIGNQIA